MKPVRFPRDEQVHDHTIEWWYWNGNVWDRQGNRYAYMDCLFRADIKKVNFPFIKAVPVAMHYFSHSLLTDVRAKRFTPHIDYVSLISNDSFRQKLLFINYMNPLITSRYTNHEMVETRPGRYWIKTEDLELELESKKKPLLEGGKGYIRLADGKSTYYYSLTHLHTKGRIRVRGRWISVIGKSWMDHQWANVPYEKNKWTWFSIQLENSMELVCIEYGKTGRKTLLAGIVHPDGHVSHSSKLAVQPLKPYWQSPKTKARYPLQWKITVPDQKISMEAHALVPRQEMLFGTINYWEGPLDIDATVGGKRVSGVGFAELVGYESEFDNFQFLKTTFKDFVRFGYDHLRYRRR
ncbi:MAG: lipocalin family protein [Patescibacteria group bacterium]|nr:lipocalin family protein [Patescibacteria group bacterium]MDD5715406.1 lipocalin family protein [Patescibacteria group bacterium]